MKNHRIFTKTWFRVGGIALVLGAALLAILLFNLPASAYPPEPTPTPQQNVELHAESHHSAGAVFDSTSPSLTGSYYQWGYAKTCLDLDWSTSPPTCIGETDTFYCGDEEINNLAVLYNVTEGGYAKTQIYRPDGTQYGTGCQWELDDPHDYGYDYWSSYSLNCYYSIACSQMTYYPGTWHTEFYVWDYGEWQLEKTLYWDLICEEECGEVWKEDWWASPDCWPPCSNGYVGVEVDTSEYYGQEVTVTIRVLKPEGGVLVSDSKTKTIYGTETDAFMFTLPIPCDAEPGEYTIQIIICDTCSGVVQHVQEHPIPINCGPTTPTHTPTTTRYPTRTSTRTPTRTPTPTPTRTRTPTPTPTITTWPTRTPTPTPTATTEPCECPSPNYTRNEDFEDGTAEWQSSSSAGHTIIRSDGLEGNYSAVFEGDQGETVHEELWQFITIPPNPVDGTFVILQFALARWAMDGEPPTGNDRFIISFYDATGTQELVRLFEFDPAQETPSSILVDLTPGQLASIAGRTVMLKFVSQKVSTGLGYSVAIDCICLHLTAGPTPTSTPTITSWPTRTPTATRTVTPTPTTTPCQCWVHFPFYENEKSYAQKEITIDPYPVQMGIPTKLCVTIVNDANVPKTVMVEFEMADFGIGLGFNTIPAAGNPRPVTVPAKGEETVCIIWTPTLSDIGHRCIQVTISGQCCHDLKSQKNLDVRERLRPGQTDTLTIPVRNPFPEVVDIRIDVFNHCDGWNVYAEPSYLYSMGYLEVRDVVLHVMPPYGKKLGSGCCIDIEAVAIRGYPHYDEVLIGGVRKCDEGNFVDEDQPHFAEREIEIDPYPLQVGKRTEVCAVLDNWGDYDETATLEFLVADFGIGLSPTRIPHPNNPQTVTVPAHSSRRFCISFVPTHVGHVCFEIVITREGYEPIESWRNMDVVEPLWRGEGDTLQFPIGNPLDHTATIDIDIDNNCPGWNVTASPDPLYNVQPGEVRIVTLSVTPQEGATLGTECTVDVTAWADDQMIGGFRKIDKPPVPEPDHGPPYAEEDVKISGPQEVGEPMRICAVLNNKSTEHQTVKVTFYETDFTMGIPPEEIEGCVQGNPRTETIPPGRSEVCCTYTPLTPGHKCYKIVFEQKGYEPVESWKNLDVGEHLRPGQQDQLVITVGNPTGETADIQIVVYSECPGWFAKAEPEILEDVEPGATRDVTLRVIPPSGETTLGSGCYIDVETYINGELISGIRKVDLPPVHPPPDEPSYAEREITIRPDPLKVGEPATICAELYNYTKVQQTADVTLYVAEFGIDMPYHEVGRIENVVFPGETAVTKCLTYTPPAGTTHVCLQVKIEQDGYMDIVSQKNIEVVGLPAVITEPQTMGFSVHNSSGDTQTVQLDVKGVGLPAGLSAEVVEGNEVTLGPGETVSRTLRIQPTTALKMLRLNDEVLPGDTHLVAVEAFINDELVGGVQFEFEVHKIYLPIILKNYG